MRWERGRATVLREWVRAMGFAVVLAAPALGVTIQDASALPAGSSAHIDQAIILTTINSACCDVNKAFRVRDDTRALMVGGLAADIDRILAGRKPGDVISFDGSCEVYGGMFLMRITDASGVSQPTISMSLAPRPVTPADFRNYSTTAEGLESDLVILRDVRFVDAAGAKFAKGNFTVSDGISTCTVNLPRGDLDLVGLPIPTGPVDLTGIFTQADFSAAMTAPGEGYQLQLMSSSGIALVPEPAAMWLAGGALLLLRRNSRKKHARGPDPRIRSARGQRAFRTEFV